MFRWKSPGEMYDGKMLLYIMLYYCLKTSQFKTVCKDDSGYITQLKQQK